MIYSVLEQHLNGSWWYHPGMSYNTREAAEERAREFPDRPTKVIKHEQPMPQDVSRYSFDCKHFDFAGGWEFTLK